MEGSWGLLGPEFLPNMRRTRTLGLAATVRRFNDLAVPGLGGVWYGKQLVLATLGVAVAENARKAGTKVNNIEAANAIEALACWLAFRANSWTSDARLRGSTKLKGIEDFSFRKARQRNFYVTQPMRMATVQALPALGLVEPSTPRFNAFNCLKEGTTLIEAACGSHSPYKRTLIDHLTQWVRAEDNRVDSPPLRQLLSPLNPLPSQAISLLRERLIQGGSEPLEDKARRANALAWVEALRINPSNQPTWDQCPAQISAEHWQDLRAGALFFEARQAAIDVLDAVEAHIGNQSDGQCLPLKKQLPGQVWKELKKLIAAAKEYLAFEIGSDDKDARVFCQECLSDEPAKILQALVARDQHVLRLIGDEVKPGPAFQGFITTSSAKSEEPEQDESASDGISLPEGISYRMRNLFLLNLDMQGELDGWLTSYPGKDSEA